MFYLYMQVAAILLKQFLLPASRRWPLVRRRRATVIILLSRGHKIPPGLPKANIVNFKRGGILREHAVPMTVELWDNVLVTTTRSRRPVLAIWSRQVMIDRLLAQPVIVQDHLTVKRFRAEKQFWETYCASDLSDVLPCLFSATLVVLILICSVHYASPIYDALLVDHSLITFIPIYSHSFTQYFPQSSSSSLTLSFCSLLYVL
jgi:hypothetical protein